MNRRSLLGLVPATLAATALGGRAGHAQDPWPSRPVTVAVPFVPGGSSDVVARAMAGPMQQTLGKPVVVENRPGASGEIAARYVMRTPPDGHNLMVGSIGTWAINPALRPNLAYDPLKDFTPVTLAATTPNVFVVNPDYVPARTLQDFIAWLKENTGKASYGTSGVGSSDQMTVELFRQLTGTDLAHVPYSGGGAALTDLFAGTVQLMCTNLGILTPHIEAGRLRALVVTSATRHRLLPDVPSVVEAGLPDLVMSSWQGIMAPANMPAPLLERVNAALVKALRDPTTQGRLEAIGFDVVADTPQAFGEFLRGEIERWRGVIRKADIRVD